MNYIRGIGRLLRCLPPPGNAFCLGGRIGEKQDRMSGIQIEYRSGRKEAALVCNLRHQISAVACGAGKDRSRCNSGNEPSIVMSVFGQQ